MYSPHSKLKSGCNEEVEYGRMEVFRTRIAAGIGAWLGVLWGARGGFGSGQRSGGDRFASSI